MLLAGRSPCGTLGGGCGANGGGGFWGRGLGNCLYQDRLVKILGAGHTRRVRLEWKGGRGEGTRVGGPRGPATLEIGSWCVVGAWGCCQCLAPWGKGALPPGALGGNRHEGAEVQGAWWFVLICNGKINVYIKQRIVLNRNKIIIKNVLYHIVLR